MPSEFPTPEGGDAGRWCPDGKGTGHHTPAAAKVKKSITEVFGKASEQKSFGSGKYSMRVEITSCNVKRIDLKAYGLNVPNCWVKINVGPHEARTCTLFGLDPIWEDVYEFKFDTEPKDTEFKATFYMDEAQDGGKQIGDTQRFLLEVLVIGKQLFKQLVVPGGGVNFMVTADNFGKEDVPMGDTLGFLDDDDEGGMMMDSDEDDE
ncbi:hypothetical protein PPROV_000757500 [Pycnococcus provasolii]|uniref:C2 domain-containing protein n=1 Tax=Pycnococcus provasolii TaxID=41880 RepID=A0A830HPI6_9CHLO|nr:hypothetical protein PPROV_000757500 [Pycnococcus provasolii]|mmetsp:Transcript_10336/g.26251  ORF Transcript_10336/g.26251 Transcript_10336/m.26251 type:complete len:206 (+) Transcript_10336:91-708(+)